ncbi:MAG TPA: hypothetical protein VGJ20_08870 [Xanthobacteraceae bacterium]
MILAVASEHVEGMELRLLIVLARMPDQQRWLRLDTVLPADRRGRAEAPPDVLDPDGVSDFAVLRMSIIR